MAFHLLQGCIAFRKKPQGFFFRLKAFNDRETGKHILQRCQKGSVRIRHLFFLRRKMASGQQGSAKREKGGRQSRCGQKRAVREHQTQNTNQHEHIGRKGK